MKMCVIEGFRLASWPVSADRNKITYSVILSELNEDDEVVYFHSSQTIVSPTPLVMGANLATDMQALVEADATSRGWLA